MDVQWGVWKVVPRAEVFVQIGSGRVRCWLGTVAPKEVHSPPKKGFNIVSNPFPPALSSVILNKHSVHVKTGSQKGDEIYGGGGPRPQTK
jgi:hypothetical protein